MTLSFASRSLSGAEQFCEAMVGGKIPPDYATLLNVIKLAVRGRSPDGLIKHLRQ